MPTRTFKPATSADDGLWSPGGGLWSPTSVGEYCGYDSASRNTFIRFPSLTIPPKTTIDSAKIIFCAYSSLSANNANVRIYANDVGDATAPTSGATAEALVLTTAYVDWDVIASWTINTYYDSPDLTAIIQEIINRDDYVLFSALTIVIKDNSSTVAAHRIAHSYDGLVEAKYPILSITYASTSTGNGVSVLPTLTLNSTSYTGETAGCIFPVMTLSAHAEVAPVASLNVNLPSLSLEASVSVHGTVDISLPSWTVTSRTGEGTSLTLPKATLTSSALHAYPGIMVASFPGFTCAGIGLTGVLGSGAVTLSKLTSTGTAYDIPVGTFNSELPGFTAYATGYSSDRFANYVLRYTR